MLPTRAKRLRLTAPQLTPALLPKGKYAIDADLPLQGERQDRLLDVAIADVVVDADEVDRLVAHDRLELG